MKQKNNNALVMELKTIKALSKILSSVERPLSNPEDLKGKGVLDPADVCLVEGMTEWGRKILSHFVEEENKAELKNTPILNYSLAGSSKYSLTYLTRIMTFLECSFESVKLEVAGDYPLTASNEHFKVILAPRVDND